MIGRDLIPKEVSGRLPLLTLCGTERLQIEQHQGLTNFQDGRISFRTAAGEVTITGANMRFLSYSGTDAILCGKIKGICFGVAGEDA